MKHRSPKVLYFSITKPKGKNRTDDFWKWVKYGTANSLTYQKNFLFDRVVIPEPVHAADLALYLEQIRDNLQSYHIIIDIESIPIKQIEVIHNLVIQYPEVQFLFDRRKANEDFDLLETLFPQDELAGDIKNREDKKDVESRWELVKQAINTELIIVSWEDPKVSREAFMQRIIAGRDNTFDASNLRYAIKYRKYISLKVDCNRNFAKLQDSRKDHMAVCI